MSVNPAAMENTVNILKRSIIEAMHETENADEVYGFTGTLRHLHKAEGFLAHIKWAREVKQKDAEERARRAANKAATGCRRVADGCDWPNCPCEETKPEPALTPGD